MKKRTLIAALVAPLLLVTALESQWIGYAGLLVRSATASGPEGDSPMQQTIDRAFDPATGRLELLAMGDIANCPEAPGLSSAFPVTSRLLGLPSPFDPEGAAAVPAVALAKADTAPVLALGDLVYSSGKPGEFADCFDPLWSQLYNRTLPTLGNHEYNTPGAFGYYDYWQDRAGPDARGYYAVTAGNWLILSLNSEVDASAGSAQARWLEAALAERPDACLMAFYHRPAHSLDPRKGRGNAEALFARLQRAGASFVLNGHNHFYERTVPLDAEGNAAPDGTTSFIVGTGGKTSGAHPLSATTAAAAFGQRGLLRLSLNATGYDWRYEDAGNGAILDEGQASCRDRQI
ncbi:metallophosphoesterase family protein [Salipiger aestuarii]|uniref:Calcineurin-like phosphoesterase family protein n=1 Tax=Salipiger aestuarii TaxID=568098 RepID=A0A327Y590_9RHOB|nr:metallophosphoesterase [Salipiger aestuarii]RAK15627.1 calcineurin-like phosphoesterase family protein [Salipiger aestuarii]